jgi:hypothetical protein
VRCAVCEQQQNLHSHKQWGGLALTLPPQDKQAVCLPVNAVRCCVQLACHAGRLTVLLDLDGTLVSSFTPRRAPVLPPSMKTHLVGVGSSLNPAGVFVVERPGLTPFLQQLAAMSEVVVFTAGEQALLLGQCRIRSISTRCTTSAAPPWSYLGFAIWLCPR